MSHSQAYVLSLQHFSLILSDKVGYFIPASYLVYRTAFCYMCTPRTERYPEQTTFVKQPFSGTNGISQYQNISILDFIGAKDDGGSGESWS